MKNITVDGVARALQILTSVIAIVALSLVIAHINDVQTSRRDAAIDSCHLLRGLVHAATSHAPRARKAANAYVHHTQLRNCTSYGRRVTR